MVQRNLLLRPYTLSALLFAEVGIVIALIILDHLSHKNKGFVSVNQNVKINIDVSNLNFESVWGQAFLWTSVPSLLMILFNLAWKSVIGAFTDETPFRELQRPDGCTMKQSVLLDYRRNNLFNKWSKAMKNGHWFLGLCMLFSLFNEIALVPFAAHLFQVIYPNIDQATSFPLNSFYNDSRLVPKIDYQPILETVSAVWVHGGNWPLWTDGIHAIPAIGFPDNKSASSNVTQVRVNITAQWAELDCEVVTDYTISKIQSDGETATISISATDRGCNISVEGGVGPGSQTFLKTNSIRDCSEASGWSRISFYAGSYSASAQYLLDDMSVISCIPVYSQGPGIVIAPQSFQPISFERSPGQATDSQPRNWQNFESEMLSLSNIGDNNSPDFTSAFGGLTLDIARSNVSSSVLSTESLISSASMAFSSVFAVLATSMLFQTLPAVATTPGILTVSDTRLSVVIWSAYISIALILGLIVLTISLIIIVPKRRPLLSDAPRGILEAASFLYDENLKTLINDANSTEGYDGQFYLWVKKHYILGLETCRIKQDGMIECHNLVEKPRTHNPVTNNG